MKILHVVSEAEPFAKTGGLGDVAAALPKATAALGHDVRVVLPLYQAIDRARHGLQPTALKFPVTVGPQTLPVRVWQGRRAARSAAAFFIECAAWFDRPGLYQDGDRDHPDNLARFSALAQSALRLFDARAWHPDIVHCHDWQTALVCAHMRYGHPSDPPAPKTVLTIHNLAYQGVFPRTQWPLTGLPDRAFGMDGLECYGQINCLKGGVVSADHLTTVSPTYACEIQTPEFGCGLEGVVRGRSQHLTGILNGIDVDAWNPKTDPHLGARYTAQRLTGKAVCKAALQAAMGLPATPRCLIGMVQRLAEQKGIDLLLQAMERLMALPLQVVLLGTGEARYHRQLEAFARRFPKTLAVRLRFDDALAHQIEAGADAFLMPSRFEPCGLNQMYSMRYGTVPIVRRVGGLADTVTAATGFVFEPYASSALVQTVERALAVFQDRTAWQQLMRNGMQQDFSWAQSARAYLAVYTQVLKQR